MTFEKKKSDYIGIDVASEHLDVAWSGSGKVERFPYSKSGLSKLIHRIPEASHVIFESTGGYEFRLACALHEGRFRYSQLNPRAVRKFAQATGEFAKTDQIDARMLVRFADALKPRQTIQMPAHLLILKNLVDRRSQLVKMSTAEKNRRTRHKHQGFCCDSFTTLLKHLDVERKAIEAKIKTALQENEATFEHQQLLESVPGISTTIAAVIITHLPELGKLDRRQIAKLVGLAPLNNDSGKHRGKRSIFGGRERVRTALYMSVISGINHNPKIKKSYQRFRSRNMPPKVAIIACARKLLTQINAMIRDQQPWQKEELPVIS